MVDSPVTRKMQALERALAELRSVGHLTAADLSADWRLQRAVERDVLILVDVVVELCVAQSGIVDDVKLVTSSGHPLLDNATIAGLQRSRFEPATRDGRPVRLCGHPLTMGWRLNAAPP